MREGQRPKFKPALLYERMKAMVTPLSASNVSEGQKVEAVRIITDAARKAATAAIDKLVASGAMEGPNFQKNVVESSEFVEGLQSSLQATVESELLSATRSWREKDGVIYLTVVSDGTIGSQWITRLEKKGFRLTKWAKDVLNSADFKPTKGVVYHIAILKGILFSDSDRVTRKIRAFAAERKLTAPNAEVAGLIRENFSDEDIAAMGLWWIVAMHEPIEDSDGGPDLLGAYRLDGGRCLHAYDGGPGRGWDSEDGFAFVLSQVSTQN